jgi:hypothetical protein
MSSNHQENPNKVKDCIKTKDGRYSVEKLTGCAGFIIFAVMLLLTGLEILSTDILSEIGTGILTSGGILTGNSFGKNH